MMHFALLITLLAIILCLVIKLAIEQDKNLRIITNQPHMNIRKQIKNACLFLIMELMLALDIQIDESKYEYNQLLRRIESADFEELERCDVAIEQWERKYRGQFHPHEYYITLQQAMSKRTTELTWQFQEA